MIFIGLGSSIGDAEKTFNQAQLFLEEHKIKVLKKSKILKNPPFGGIAKNEFSNAVWALSFKETRWEKINWILLPQWRRQQLKAYKLLTILQRCENQLGRSREKRWDDRTLDLDLLMFHQHTSKRKKLIIPHPGITERSFVLHPWQEIVDEDFQIPRFGLIKDLIKNLD